MNLNPFYIDDYGLTPAELEERYEKRGQHPGYQIQDWVSEVALRDTLLGYWDWVFNRLVDESDELQRDNPFTQGSL